MGLVARMLESQGIDSQMPDAQKLLSNCPGASRKDDKVKNGVRHRRSIFQLKKTGVIKKIKRPDSHGHMTISKLLNVRQCFIHAWA